MGVLINSSQDVYCLAEAVESRFLDLCHAYERIRGTRLPMPASLDADIFRWRQMRVRHKRRDFRHSEAELKSVQNIAQWLVDTNATLRNQEPTVIDWGGVV